MAHALPYHGFIARSPKGSVIAFRTHGCAPRKEDARENTMTFITRLRALVCEDAGQDLIEYAMLVALIALLCVGAVTAAGGQVQAIFNAIVPSIPV